MDGSGCFPCVSCKVREDCPTAAANDKLASVIIFRVFSFHSIPFHFIYYFVHCATYQIRCSVAPRQYVVTTSLEKFTPEISNNPYITSLTDQPASKQPE